MFFSILLTFFFFFFFSFYFCPKQIAQMKLVLQVPQFFFLFFLLFLFFSHYPLSPIAHLAASVVDEFGEEKIQRILDQAQNNCFGWWDSARK